HETIRSPLSVFILSCFHVSCYYIMLLLFIFFIFVAASWGDAPPGGYAATPLASMRRGLGAKSNIN
ncbi:MAG: hypothetical protein FWG51_06195, partial [Firmicutes bacterium]|nr:hypothetical protein [Bacillota bacterium]